jgi:hypothetical protein
MSNPRRRAIKKEPEINWRTTSANTLKQVRETLGAQIQEKMSAYTNRHLWKNAQTSIPAAPLDSDPEDIKILKNYLLLLLYFEQTIQAGKNFFRMSFFGIYNSLMGLPSIANTSGSLSKEIIRIINLTKAGKYKLADIQAITDTVTDHVKALINYRNPAPNNPALSFAVPPQPSIEWWAENPAPLPKGGQLINFEYDYLMNPIRKLLSGLDTVFPELELNKIPFIDRGFLPVPDIDHAKFYFQQQQTFKLSLKALYNLAWALNRMGRGFLAHGKIQATIDLKDFGLGALENLQLLDFSNNIPQEIHTRIIFHYKEYLKKLEHVFLSFTESDLAAIQQYEIDHHLKPGAISGVLKLLFDRLEDFYLANNIYFINPFVSQKNTVALITQLNNNDVAVERARLDALLQHCEALEANLNTVFLDRTLTGSTATRDEFIMRVLQNLTQLIIREKPQALDKINMQEIQNSLIQELSTTGRRALLQTLADSAVSEEQALSVSLTTALAARERPTSFQWLASAGTVLNAYTPDVVRIFVTSFFSPFTMPTAFTGNTLHMPIVKYDLHLIFALPANHALTDTFVITQETGELIYIDSNGRSTPILNESEIEKDAPFLKAYLDLNTEPLPIVAANRPEEDDEDEEKKSNNDINVPRIPAARPAIDTVGEKSKSIKREFSQAQLTILNHLIAAKNGPQHALLPNRGLSTFLKKTITDCREKIRDIDRTREELTQGINQSDNDLALARFRATMRLLEPRDLLRMIHAVKLTANNPMLNLDIKSRLAALVADIKGENRERYVKDAHRVATELVRHPERIIALINLTFANAKSTLDDKILCRELMTQLALLENIRIELLPEQILQFVSHDENRDTQMVKRCISALLTQFDPIQLAEENDTWSIVKSNQALAVLNLIIRQNMITTDAIKAELRSYKGINRQSYTLTMLFDLYQRYHEDPTLQKQTGIFMTNIALHDTNFAQLIFSADHDSEFLKSLQQSCLGSDKKNSTLYYEAWVNSLEIRYKAPKNALTLDELAHNNEDAILRIYKVQNPTEATPTINDLLQHPWQLCKLIGSFMTGFISRDSRAEEKMRKLFLFMVYGKGQKCESIRKELTRQYYANGVSDAPYYQFIVPKYTVGEQANNFNIFWQEAKNNLIRKMREMIDSLSETKKLLNLDAIKDHTPLAEQFNQKIVEIYKLIGLLTEKNSKIDTACYQIRRSFLLYQEEAMHIASQIQTLTTARTRTQSQSQSISHSSNTSPAQRDFMSAPRPAVRALGSGIFQNPDASTSSQSSTDNPLVRTPLPPPKRNSSGNGPSS